MKLERVDGDDVVFVQGEVIDTTDAELFISGQHDYRITTFDGAGNESEPTIIPTDLDCPGSCAATTGAPAGALGLTLLLLRKRRR